MAQAAIHLAAHALLARTLTPSREEIVEAISANPCRCTGYGQIVEAIALAAKRLRAANEAPGAEGGVPSRAPADWCR